MKNINVFSNFKNSLSTFVLISIPKNIVVQHTEEIVDYTQYSNLKNEVDQLQQQKIDYNLRVIPKVSAP
jgi:hypothetical protein